MLKTGNEEVLNDSESAVVILDAQNKDVIFSNTKAKHIMMNKKKKAKDDGG